MRRDFPRRPADKYSMTQTDLRPHLRSIENSVVFLAGITNTYVGYRPERETPMSDLQEIKPGQEIKPADIKKGDRIRAVATGCLSPDKAEFTRRWEYVATADRASVQTAYTATCYLIERPVVLPTEPGYYLDKEGDVWVIREAGDAICAVGFSHGLKPHQYAPFTRLIEETKLTGFAETVRKNLIELSNATRLEHYQPSFGALINDALSQQWR